MSPRNGLARRSFKGGLRFAGPLFTAFYHQGAGVKRPLILVSRKAAPKAALRNRIRRRLQEALRRKPWRGELVLLGRKAAAEAPWERLKSEVDRLTRLF